MTRYRSAFLCNTGGIDDSIVGMKTIVAVFVCASFFACSGDGNGSSSSGGSSGSSGTSSGGSSGTSGSTTSTSGSSSSKYSCKINGTCYKCPDSASMKDCVSNCTSTDSSYCD